MVWLAASDAYSLDVIDSHDDPQTLWRTAVSPRHTKRGVKPRDRMFFRVQRDAARAMCQ